MSMNLYIMALLPLNYLTKYCCNIPATFADACNQENSGYEWLAHDVREAEKLHCCIYLIFCTNINVLCKPQCFFQRVKSFGKQEQRIWLRFVGHPSVIIGIGHICFSHNGVFQNVAGYGCERFFFGD